jgi:hypothetical protein
MPYRESDLSQYIYPIKRIDKWDLFKPQIVIKAMGGIDIFKNNAPQVLSIYEDGKVYNSELDFMC